MKDHESILFSRFFFLLEQETGIEISAANEWHVTQRIHSLCHELQLSLQELDKKLHSSSRQHILPRFIECALVQESFFFRDPEMFCLLENEILPSLNEKLEHIHIWSCACAFGQEIYSVAMLCHKLNLLHKTSFWGSDISERAIQKAQKGIYSDKELTRSLTQNDIQLFFTPYGTHWKISAELQKNVEFFLHNLLYPTGKRDFYHIILLKNVLMYFTTHNREKCIHYIRNTLSPEGVIIISNPQNRIIHALSSEQSQKLFMER